MHLCILDGLPIRLTMKQIIKLTNKPFTLKYWSNDYLVMPARYMTEVKGAHKDDLSFLHNISDVWTILTCTLNDSTD